MGVRVYTCMYLGVWMCMYVHVCGCVDVCVCVFIFIHSREVINLSMTQIGGRT